MMKNLLILIMFLFIGQSTFSQQFKYIGADKCKICHNNPSKGEQYSKWLNDSHSKAMNSLSETEKQDPKCLKCHSTFYSVDETLRLTITKEEGVSCESCHGPGSIYKNMAIMKDKTKSIENGLVIPTKEVCIKCHNNESPTFKGFDYDEYLQKVKH